MAAILQLALERASLNSVGLEPGFHLVPEAATLREWGPEWRWERG